MSFLVVAFWVPASLGCVSLGNVGAPCEAAEAEPEPTEVINPENITDQKLEPHLNGDGSVAGLLSEKLDPTLMVVGQQQILYLKLTMKPKSWLNQPQPHPSHFTNLRWMVLNLLVYKSMYMVKALK